MKTKFLGIALAVAMIVMPLSVIQSARAQTEPVAISIPDVIWDVENDGMWKQDEEDPTRYYTIIYFNDEPYYIWATDKNEDGTISFDEADRGIYDEGGYRVGRITDKTTGVLEFLIAELVVEITGFSHNLYGGDGTKWYYCSSATINGIKTNFSEPIVLKGESGTLTIDGTTYYYNKTGALFSDPEHKNEVGELAYAYALHPGDEFKVRVTEAGTGERVGGAIVKWGGATASGVTNTFGEVWLTVQDMTFFDAYGYGNWGVVQATKEYGESKTLVRSAYGASDMSIAVIPYDLSSPTEFLAWWSYYSLEEEAQAMYEAAEILGEWGSGVPDVTVWSNIFGPKGGSLAKFIRDFPQFLVDRGAALEATQNMLDTIWALFTLLPAFVLATPQLLQTAPMRMLQFWPALFINLDLVLDGISQMVIDLGLFMTSLAPSMLLLLPEMLEALPELVPEAMEILLTSVQFFIDVIPALAQYGVAAVAAVPAFFIQMLQALFYNGPAIFDVALSESINTIENLFRSWPLFPAGIAAGILAVAPALMTLPAYAPFVVGGQVLENLTASLSTYMQQLREMPSRLLDSVMSLAELPGMIPRYILVGLYLLVTVPLLLPAIAIAAIVLGMSLAPLGILGLSLALAPFAAVLMFVPVLGWGWDIIWACWMGVSVFASWAATLPGKVFGLVDTIVYRSTQIFQILGYPVGWCIDGCTGILSEGMAADIAALMQTSILPALRNVILPALRALMSGTVEGGQSAILFLSELIANLLGAALYIP